MVQKFSEEKNVGTAEIIKTVAALKDELKRSDPSIERVTMLFTRVYNYDLDQLIKADKIYGGSLLKELDSASKKFKELADVSEKRFKDTKARFDKLRESDPVNYANARVEVLKKLRPEIENESERIYYEMQKAHARIEQTPAVDKSIPLASKGVETEQMKRKETEKAKKEQLKKKMEEKAEREQVWKDMEKDIAKNWEKYAFGVSMAVFWGEKAFPSVKNLFGPKHLGPTLQKINWNSTVELAKTMDQTAARVGPNVLKYLGTTASAVWAYLTTFTAVVPTVSAWSIVWPVAVTAVAYEAAFRPQDITGVIDRAGDKITKRQEYNLKIVDVARYETMCEVNQRKTFALVKDINLEHYTTKYEKLGVKIGEGKEIASILKKVPGEAKLYLATKLYEIEERVKVAKGEDFTSSPEYLKFVLKNLKQ